MTLTPVPDAHLAARFAVETRPLLEMLHRGARRLTRTEADAEDLLQDTLLHAYAGYPKFQHGTNLKAWLFKIMYHRWVSNHRSQQRRPVETPVDEMTDRMLARAGAHVSAESEVLSMLSDSGLTDALAQLPDGFTDVLFHTFVEGYTYAETAAIMDIPVGTVMSRASRARQRLRDVLAPAAGWVA
ncbi:sigma-70 family RNA polymerase sigma factor [Mycobacterium sp. MBM]|nr:sigma-70 family RNA polymerase sigma factor [Mycobacterium sp. MBM]